MRQCPYGYLHCTCVQGDSHYLSCEACGSTPAHYYAESLGPVTAWWAADAPTDNKPTFRYGQVCRGCEPLVRLRAKVRYNPERYHMEQEGVRHA